MGGFGGCFCTNVSNIMSKCHCYTLMEVLPEVFIDEDSNFDPEVADSFSTSREQVCETSWPD